jgi:hypothetical protein
MAALSRLARRPFLSLIVLCLLIVLISACNTAPSTGTINTAQIPAGAAWAEGKQIFFSHTEASDPDIAEALTNMMKSPVLVVPSLAGVPESALATVYVFENGVKGKGPLGFQPDVFDNPPGTDGYSPLRKIVLVKWIDASQAKELKSEGEVLQAETDGLVSTSQPGVVVNMPFMVWDGGKR